MILLSTTGYYYFKARSVITRSKNDFPNKRAKQHKDEGGELLNESKSTIMPISIPPGFGNAYLKKRYLNPLSGFVGFKSEDFQMNLESLIFDTNEPSRSSFRRNDGCKEVEFRLPQPIENVKAVHLLVNSGNSKSIYENDRIGEIKLIFKDVTPVISTELILGENIREWCIGNSGNLVRRTRNPSVKQAWTGTNLDGTNAVMDRLEIPVDMCMRVESLEKIIFVHIPIKRGTDEKGVHFSVFGINVEIQRASN